MKKFLFLIAAAAAVAFVSCDKKEDDKFTPPASLAGTTWQHQLGGTASNPNTYTTTITFNSETEYTMLVEDTLNGTAVTETDSYTYNATTGIATFAGEQFYNNLYSDFGRVFKQGHMLVIAQYYTSAEDEENGIITSVEIDLVQQ